MKYLKWLAFLNCTLALIVFLIGCNSEYTPKPRGYFKIDFPSREYQKFDQAGYPYKFEYPVYANISRDSSDEVASPDDQYWINVDFPGFNARLYLSYKTIGGKSLYKVKAGNGYKDSLGVNTFDNLRDEAYKMATKHSVKASSIEDSAFKTQNGIAGVFFSIGGNAATSSQFYMTDTSKHFFRGSLYFNAVPNEDSLSIVNQFLAEDIKHLVNTLQWKNGSSKN